MKINLGLVASSLTAAVVMASTDPNAADMSAADEQTFFKEHASNNIILNGALASIAELKAEMAAKDAETAATIAKLESKHAAEMAAMKSKDAEHDAIIASLKAHRHGVVPSNLRRRTQEEMSMSMPATANIWNSGGDEEPEENFFSDWDNHKESCCDHVTDLKGRVSKLEDEVGDLNQCVKFVELYKIDEDSSSKNTCRLGLGVSQVEILGTDRVATRTYNEDEGRVSVSTEAFDVDAQGSVSVVAKDGTATVEAHDDIILKSKNNIEAHAGNDIKIKADMDVYITADESSGSVGDVKIAGENVNVDADKSVNMAAKEHVMVDAGHNVTVKAGDTVTVEADEDVKIVGQEIRVNAEASVDVSAKEHVRVNADDDVKISGENVDVNANDDVKISGDNVGVNANDDVKISGDNVGVNANDDVKITGQDIRVDAEASVDVSAKKNVMVNADQNVTVMADDTVTVEADDDVKIVGQDVHIDAHEDIVLKSKNDIMAHAENNTVIKAEADVHITADANGGSDGDVKIAGEGVYVDAEATVDVSAKKNVMVNAEHNVTVMAGDTVTVEANDDIKIAGQDVHVEADVDVNIAGGGSVHVEADVDVKIMANNTSIMANNDVIVDAAVDNSDNGNVKIEGVKYFPQKQEICSNDDYENFVVEVIEEDFTFERFELLDKEGHLAFGNITVGNGPGDVVVDIVASTAQLVAYGVETSFLTRKLIERFQVNDGKIYLTVELHPSGAGGAIHPVPNAPIYLRTFEHVDGDTPDEFNDGDEYFVPKPNKKGTFQDEGSTNPAKLIFPEVPPGDYDVKVRFFVELFSLVGADEESISFVGTDVDARVVADDDDETRSLLGDDDPPLLWTYATARTELTLGPHYISVSVIDASHEQCGGIAWSCIDGIPTCPITDPGWVRVRHVPTGPTWHPATDSLAGTDVYGNSQDDSAPWSINFAGEVTGYNQFLFATGDCAHWLIADKGEVITPDPTGSIVGGYRSIQSSSKQCDPYEARWYNRSPIGNPVYTIEDPWISVIDHVPAITSGEIVYGEDSFGLPHAQPLLDHNGADVYIRFDD